MDVSRLRMQGYGYRSGWARLGLTIGLFCGGVAVCMAADVPKDATLPLSKRVQIAAQIRADVEQYFAHWQGTGDLDFDAEYAKYLDQISSTDDRRAFDMATLKLFASLKNGHTVYEDRWLRKNSGPGTGLWVEYTDGQWIVLDTAHPLLPRGTVITSIDGQAIDAFFADKSIYINGSEDLARRNHLFNIAPLFNMVFNVGTADGHTVRVDRNVHATSWLAQNTPPKIPGDMAYVHIDSFDDPHYEKDAVAYIQNHADAKAIIIDVRGNNGGSTPMRLINALELQPYRDWTEASAMSVGMLKTYGNFRDSTSEKDDPETYGFEDGMKQFFDRPMMYWPGVLRHPNAPLYKGRVIVLTDNDCASACEDFVMPMKVSHRATIVGDRTFGSSGQPFMRKIDDDISYRIGAKRMFFGDGSAFEGVGIEPDIKIVPSAQQIRDNDDPVLAKAVELAQL